ncbi:hypothetical protein BH09PSE5_BH09PSE5_04630 [soil metagenome]
MSIVSIHSPRQTTLFRNLPHRLPPTFLLRSNKRVEHKSPAVVSPLFACRPWLQDNAAIELGWDYAHHGIRPSLEALCSSADLKQGYQAGLAVFGRRTLKLTPYVKPWLETRFDALQRSIEFDTLQINARYIEQIAATHCPATRQALDIAEQHTVIGRLRTDIGYVAGNLFVMSRTARISQRGLRMTSTPAAARATRLDPADQARLEVLQSFGEALSHAAASRVPMLVLPPNRLHVRNPIQVLQALASLSLACGDDRFEAMRAAMPGKQVRDHVDAFADAFAASYRMSLSATMRAHSASKIEGRTLQRWAIEDAWKAVTVQLAWARLASHVDAAATERIVAKVGGRAVAITPDVDVPPQRPADQAVRLRA